LLRASPQRPLWLSSHMLFTADIRMIADSLRVRVS
jgi:hypothetical protein